MKKIVLLCIILLPIFVLAQKSYYKINISSYVINNIKYVVLTIDIYNKTREPMLLWLDKDTTLYNQKTKQRIINYFFRVKGDFSLSDIISEYGSTIQNVLPEIYLTFYKIIAPKHSFCILVLCESDNYKNVIEKIKRSLVIITPMQLEKAQVNFFAFNQLRIMSFKGNEIVLNSNDL
jgi:hypothetical protein